MTQIHVRNFSYRHASRKNPVFTDISFDIEHGEKILILGSSGSGKSTLLAAIAGIIGEDEGFSSGTLEVEDRVGMVLQDPDSQVIASRVGDDVAFGCENFGVAREDIWPRVRRGLDLVGLDLPLDYPTAELSGGQKQRLALAGVLAMGAKIILLDEPTANLDPEGVTEVVAAVDTVTRETGATVIIVEHRVKTWSHVVERCIVLDPSTHQLQADGPLSTVMDAYGAELADAGVWTPHHDPQYEPAVAYPLNNGATYYGDSAIELHDVRTGWREPLPHMSPLNLGIPLGKSTVITGANGVGKTTLLLSMCGLLSPPQGTISIHSDIANGLGSDPQRWKSRELAQRLGYVFQDPEHQFVASTVLDELLVSTRVTGGSETAATAQAWELLERLRLDHVAKANPFSLSGGQKRRLSVATTLITTPSVVFLDEPTFGQDRRTFIELVQLLRELTVEGTTVVSVTHDSLFYQAMADAELLLTRKAAQSS